MKNLQSLILIFVLCDMGYFGGMLCSFLEHTLTLNSKRNIFYENVLLPDKT